MKIAIDARPLAQPFSGIGRYTAQLVRNFAAAGHDLQLYTIDSLSLEQVGLSNVKYRASGQRAGAFGELLASQHQFAAWAKHDRPDLYWSPRHHLPSMLDRSIPAVVTVHDVVWKSLPQTMTRRGRIAEQLLMRRAFERAGGIICVSDFTRSVVQEYWPRCAGKATTVYSGGDGVVADSTLPGLTGLSEKFFLFVGTQEPRKNIDTLLAAYANLASVKANVPSLVLVARSGWGGVDARDLIRKMGPDLKVIVFDEVTDAELALLYQRALCLVLPSWLEGFGLPVAEAMHFGLPSIVSSAGALPEIAGDSALLIEPGCVESISSALALLAKDSRLRKTLAENANRRAVLFRWDECSQRTQALFAGVVSAHVRSVES